MPGTPGRDGISGPPGLGIQGIKGEKGSRGDTGARVMKYIFLHCPHHHLHTFICRVLLENSVMHGRPSGRLTRIYGNCAVLTELRVRKETAD